MIISVLLGVDRLYADSSSRLIINDNYIKARFSYLLVYLVISEKIKKECFKPRQNQSRTQASLEVPRCETGLVKPRDY